MAGGDKWDLAHQRTISAPGAWTWKVVRPEGPHLRLSDVEYAIAARMNLGLQPFPPLATEHNAAATAACIPINEVLQTDGQLGAHICNADEKLTV